MTFKTSPYASRLLASQVLAACVCDLYPGAQIVSGAIFPYGFCYDFYLEQPLDEQAAPLLELSLKKWIKEKMPVKVQEMMRENGADFLRFHHQPIAALLTEQESSNIVSFISLGKFVAPLLNCRNIEMPSTSEEAGCIKILSIAREQTYVPEMGTLAIVRIEVAVWPDPASLKQFLKRWHQFQKNDHRIIAQEMNLGICLDGCYYWRPKGEILKKIVTDWWRGLATNLGFQLVSTPSFTAAEKEKNLWIEWEDNMYQLFPNRTDSHDRLFQLQSPTQWQLPVRYAECAETFASIPLQQLYGLMKLRLFHADTFSVFCTEEQVQGELISLLQFFDEIVNIIGFEHRWYRVAARSPHAIGTVAKWRSDADSLAQAMQAIGLSYEEDSLEESEIGPRLEARISSPSGREWTGPKLTINVRPSGQNGEKKNLYRLNGSLFSSVERFIGLLLEHFAGKLPLWFAPEQVRILTVGQKKDYANALKRRIEEAGFRVGLDETKEKLGSKVHAAEQEKIPFIIIAGDREEEKALLTVRSCQKEKLQTRIRLEDFLDLLQNEAKCRRNPNEES